jgi:hypothetical protein
MCARARARAYLHHSSGRRGNPFKLHPVLYVCTCSTPSQPWRERCCLRTSSLTCTAPPLPHVRWRVAACASRWASQLCWDACCCAACLCKMGTLVFAYVSFVCCVRGVHCSEKPAWVRHASLCRSSGMPLRAASPSSLCFFIASWAT